MQKFLFLALAITGFSVSGAQVRINFAEFPMGQAPTNFHSALAGGGADGDWQVVSDDATVALPTTLIPQVTPTPSAARRHVLAQLNQDPADERFPLLIYDGETFKNLRLTTQFKIVSGTAEQMAGIVFRFQDVSNFYVIRASALGHNVRFYKVVNGVRSNPIGPETQITTNTWHTLAIQCEGDEINFWLDDRLATAPLHDSSFSSGKIGFWTKSDAVSYFGSTTIDYTPIVPPAQALVRETLAKYPRILGLRISIADEKGEPRVIASKDDAEVGRPGTDDEKKTLSSGAIFFGRGAGTVAADYPLNDRNGEPVAAVHMQLKSTSLVESRDTALARVRIIIAEMQKSVLSKDDLR